MLIQTKVFLSRSNKKQKQNKKMTTRPYFFPRCDNGLCDRMGVKMLHVPTKDWKCQVCNIGHLWERDNAQGSCSICNKEFTTFNRHHHCRGCGRNVCGNCTPYSLPITDEPSWNSGEKHRVCVKCAPDGKTVLPKPTEIPAEAPDDEGFA
jgi:hypothetical protein